MAKIVGIGACVMDTLVSVPRYPNEDTKMRADDTRLAGGGPVATGLVAAAKLGQECAYIGVLSDDNGGMFLKGDFEKYGVSNEYVTTEKGYRSFTSVIWLSEETTSRTCVFDRGNLPALKLTDAQKEGIKNAQLLMVDGNELEAAIEGAKYARENGVKVLYDAGGLYEGYERLLPHVDILIPSEEYSLGATGCETVEEAAKVLFDKYNPEIVVITCGKKGGVLYDGSKLIKYPAFTVKAVDSNGAGDVFHGAYAFAVTNGYDYEKCCIFSSAVSALKCTGVGARESVPNFSEVKEFLKENGYEL